MTYSESEPNFNFAINSASDFDSTSESGSESESDFSSAFINVDICIFFTLYLHSSKNTCGWFFNSHNRINSNRSNTSIIDIFFWYIIT